MPRKAESSNPRKGLLSLGWSPFFEEAWAPWEAKGLRPGRIAAPLVRDPAPTDPRRLEGGLSCEEGSGEEVPIADERHRAVSPEVPGTQVQDAIDGFWRRSQGAGASAGGRSRD